MKKTWETFENLNGVYLLSVWEQLLRQTWRKEREYTERKACKKVQETMWSQRTICPKTLFVFKESYSIPERSRRMPSHNDCQTTRTSQHVVKGADDKWVVACRCSQDIFPEIATAGRVWQCLTSRTLFWKFQSREEKRVKKSMCKEPLREHTQAQKQANWKWSANDLMFGVGDRGRMVVGRYHWKPVRR